MNTTQIKKAAGLLEQIGSHGSPDTVLAHITPQEAAMLKAKGGSGRRDPKTGLLHFEDSDSSESSSDSSSNAAASYGSWTPSGAYSSADSQGNFGDSAYGGYSDALNDADGRRAGYPDTIGGAIANALGYSRYGDFAGGLNNLGTVIGYAFPTLGMAGKLASLALNANRQDLPSGSAIKTAIGLPSSLFNSLPAQTSGQGEQQRVTTNRMPWMV